MPHIECVKNNGVPYLRIAEGRYVKELGRQKKIILKNLGPLSKYDDGKPDFLKRFREKFKNGEIDFDGFTYSSKIKPKKTFEITGDNNFIELKNIGYIFLEVIYNQLGINHVLNLYKSRSKVTYDLNGLTKLLVFNRILNPSSKARAFEERDDYFFNVVSCEEEKYIYRALSVLDKKATSIQTTMNTKIKNSLIGRKTDLTYYDVTNYYFETMYGDEDEYEKDDDGNILCGEDGKPIIKKKALRKKGVSKENRKEPIVQMGLYIDDNGIPVSYGLYPGNTQDKNTFTDMIKNSINKNGFGKVVAVADNGMNTQENKCLLLDQGNGYIVSKSVKQCWKSYKEWIQDETDYQIITNSLGEAVFKYKSRIVEKTLSYKDKETLEKHSKKVKEKEVVYWSLNHYKKEVKQNQKFIEYLESCKEHPDKLKDKQRKSQEFIKVIKTDPKTGEVVKTKDIVVLLEDKIQKYKDTMGYYMIITSEIEMPDKEVINKYHGLTRIEDSFRIIKTDLEGRPIYVRTNEHINAHFLICFIALTIIRIIQYNVLKFENKSALTVDGWQQGITAEKIKEALRNFKGCHDKNNNCLIVKPTEELKKLFKMLNIDYKKLYTVNDVNQLRYALHKIQFM